MHRRIVNLEREIDEIISEEYNIKKDLKKIKEELVDKTPEHFSQQDILRAFIGAMFLAFSVAFSGNILNIANKIPTVHLYLVTLFIIIILTAEIYYIGYSRVVDKQNRKFGQFWIKRLIVFYLTAFIVSFMIVYTFGIIYLVNNGTEFFKLVLIVSGPASIGASISDLLKKY